MSSTKLQVMSKCNIGGPKHCRVLILDNHLILFIYCLFSVSSVKWFRWVLLCKRVRWKFWTLSGLNLPFFCPVVEPIVSLTKGPNPLIDGANQTIAAICTAATGKPAAEIDWEGGLGEMESSSTLFPNETVTVISQYNIVPTRFARGRRITCIVRHPALEKEIRFSHVLDIQCKYF